MDSHYLLRDKALSYYTRFMEKVLLHKFLSFFVGTVCFFFLYFSFIFLTLPKLLTMQDYKPPLLTEVFDRNGEKVGEFFKQRRRLFNYEDMPKILIEAFVSAEDGSFFSHKGINYKAILRASIVNLKAGEKVQGGSTITQQVARSLLLSSKKTYTRKIKEAILALRMEVALSKQDILYIYLNQIYLGHGAYGVELASQIYFRKSTKELSLAEATLLAGIPKAPSRFSPIHNPERAKQRQAYVLERMVQEGYISSIQAKQTLAQEVKVYVRENFNKQSPYYLETVRRILLNQFELSEILTSGLRIYTAMDFKNQTEARFALRKGLEELDKRQGFRGVETNLPSSEEQEAFLLKEKKKLKASVTKFRILPSYEFMEEELDETNPQDKKIVLRVKKRGKESKDDLLKFPWQDHKARLKDKIFKVLVSQVKKETLEVKAPWGKETLELKDLKWARSVKDKEVNPFLENLTEVFKINDVISVRLKKENSESSNLLPLILYQKPLVEGALLSFDMQTQEITALVGGYDYRRSQFNRAYQSARQLGSVFKPFVYGAALERGFQPTTVISDNPLVFTAEEAEEKQEQVSESQEENLQDLWKPKNINDRFSGDILFRSALIRSLNVPTIKVIKKIGLSWASFYAHRLGIFSALNPDYTMALGSSSASLYEISKAFSVFARGGKKITPILISRVEDRAGATLLSNISLDYFFKEKIEANEEFVQEEKEKWFKQTRSTNKETLEWKRILEPGSSQLIPVSNSYIMTNLLQGVISDPEGTGRRAKVLNRALGGKTGTTDGYYDTWFVGFSPQVSTGVWVGFDKEQSLGKGETGSRVALPIWIDYMDKVHENLPSQEFSIPEGIVFVNMDGETGDLVSDSTEKVVRQAFKEGEEPKGVRKKELFSGGDNAEEESVEQNIENEDLLEEDDEKFIREDFSK